MRPEIVEELAFGLLADNRFFVEDVRQGESIAPAQVIELAAGFRSMYFVSRYLLCFAFAYGWLDAAAYRAWAVGSNGLGATFDADETHVTFRVYSSRATRIEVWLYDQPTDSAEKASVALDANPQTGIWSKSIAVADLVAKGIAGTTMTTAPGGLIGPSTQHGNRAASAGIAWPTRLVGWRVGTISTRPVRRSYSPATATPWPAAPCCCSLSSKRQGIKPQIPSGCLAG